MEEIDIPELTDEQMEELCEAAEEAARKHILFKVPLNKVSNMDVTVDIQGSKPLTVSVDLEIALSPLMRGCDVHGLASEAKEKAFSAVEKYLKGLACKSKE